MVTGTMSIEWLDSKLLAGNPAGLSPKRPIAVYTPPEALRQGATRFPWLMCLSPWTNAGRNQLQWMPFKESLPERVERLVAQGKIPPAFVVCPDLYTEFGGSQFIDSEFFGPHASFIVKELIPFVENKYPVIPGPSGRGVFGRSSGGFGALRLVMDFPHSFAAVAAHSADLGFDLMFGTDLLSIPNRLRRFDNSVQEFLKYCRSASKINFGDIHVLMLLGCAGFYSGDDQAPDGFHLPIDGHTGRKLEKIWQQWLSHDPVNRVGASLKGLKGLSYLYLECGLRDQYNLLYGARQFAEALQKHDIKHEYFEFDDDHSGTEYRFDESLPRMLRSLGAR